MQPVAPSWSTSGSTAAKTYQWQHAHGCGRSFCRRPIRFCARFSVYSLRLGFLLRIRWTCLIISVLEDNHFHSLAAELFCLCIAWHVDVDVVADHLSTSVF